ncbi:DCC1-like thiol-disulfide oxidoreductase family protein [Demequina sp. SYSU T00192]|uniref:DCC1-like thiol-disulfide oxidoreductase family protein n=1 Tax=Demequina litoralis TaxID=3051660 RepID=A0ABT8GCA3_9MICO|nr:DCC1-like thiol-disulfide oxidoreductase family protein [Demequina sp. SYSU T00192]MDN4476766.1 DCC1-like thiol-disulfide oxidoreductase family protein [Demequina sp. SYSU T00192]
MRAIVIFDGDCGLCNGFVEWLLRRDREGRFLIAGSAGAPGRAALEASGLGTGIARSSIVVWDGGAGRVRTDALVRIARGLPWPWRAAVALRIVPRVLRDGVYDQVARRRPRRAAEDPACGIPPADLVALWRSRLATTADVAALASEPGHTPAPRT